MRCEAARASNVDAHLLDGAQLVRQRDGLARCRNVLCPYCHWEVMNARRRELVGRTQTAVDDNMAFAHVTLTMRSVPLGQLEQQREAICAAAATALRCARRRSVRAPYCDYPDALLGHLNADHIVLRATAKWHLHRHLVVAAPSPDAVLGIAWQIAEAFRGAMQRNDTLAQLMPYAKEAPNPVGFIGYLTEPWSTRADDPGGSLTPMALAARALAGDQVCRAAFIEVTRTIARRALFRGAGVLGKACNRSHRQ